MKLENRKGKVLVTLPDLQQAWDEIAARFDFTKDDVTRSLADAEGSPADGALGDRVEERLTERAATFSHGELRTVLLEQSVGELTPAEALAFAKTMVNERQVLPLEGGLMTTLTVRAREQAIERRFGRLAVPAGREVGETAREIASEQVAEIISGHLSEEQAHALETITGPERGAILVGPAGTGKGIVIDAGARAEQLTGHETIGIAVSWSTAERLGRDSPALAGSVFSVDALISRVEHGHVSVDKHTTIYLDEAGMADTDRLNRLCEMVERTGAKLVAIGDSAQLPSIGAGGMFDRLAEIAPSAQLSNIRRTLDPAEQQAWADLRAGRSDRAMAHYQSQGQLHMADTRDDAVEHAVKHWATLTETIPRDQIALISDASNQEIHRLNARAQHLLAARGELGELEVEVPGVHYGVGAGDRVTMIEQHRTPGEERIENGSRGEILDITPDRNVLIEFDITGRQRTLTGDDLSGYALDTHNTSIAPKAPPSPAHWSLPAVGRHRRSPPTSRRRVHVREPTGTSPVRTSGQKDTTPTASSASPRQWVAVVHKHHPLHTRSWQTPTTGGATPCRARRAAAAVSPASPRQ